MLWSALIVAGLLAPSASATEPAGLELVEGRPFPDLLLPSIVGGTPRSIADFRGRKVVLHIFASW